MQPDHRIMMRKSAEARDLQYAVAQRLRYGFRLGVDLQLIVDIADVRANGIDTDVQLSACGLIAMAFHQQLQQADLVGCEVMGRARQRR